MEYSKDMFAKFTSAISDNNQNDADPTLLFIATDGNRLFKAFAGPASSVVGGFQVSKGFDDGVFIGIWSHDYLRDMIVNLEETDDPDNGWSKQMEDMVMAISDYADANPDLDNTPRG